MTNQKSELSKALDIVLAECWNRAVARVGRGEQSSNTAVLEDLAQIANGLREGSPQSQNWQWISISQTLPHADGQYLVFAPAADSEHPFMALAWYEQGEGWLAIPKCWERAITHWMAKPMPPDSPELSALTKGFPG